jgi:hypothetical protein
MKGIPSETRRGLGGTDDDETGDAGENEGA